METNDVLQWGLTGGFALLTTLAGRWVLKLKKKLTKVGHLALEIGEALVKTDIAIKNFNKRFEDNQFDADEAKATIADIKELVEEYKDIPIAVKELLEKEK